MRPHKNMRLPALVLLLLFCSPFRAAMGTEGALNTLCFGDVIDQYGGFNRFVVVRMDPAIETTFVPSRPDYLGGNRNALRNMRMYMPRTYGLLVDNYDLILSSDTDKSVFEPRWIGWMSDSITDEGLGLLWLGCIVHFGHGTIDWRGTELAEVLPTEPCEEFDIYGSFRITIEREEEALMKALPWEEAPPLANLNTQIPKRGSEVWATIEHGRSYPLIAYWNIGEGATLCFTSKFPNGVKPWTMEWDHFPQAMIYLVYRTAGKQLPSDPGLHKSLLSSFSEYRQFDSMMIALFSFIERFGGRVDGLYGRLDEITADKARADAVYMEGRFNECLEIMKEIKVKHNLLMEKSFKARDSALLWVHITEWCATTAAFILGGGLVWGLMVRRELYREVDMTRSGSNRG